MSMWLKPGQRVRIITEGDSLDAVLTNGGRPIPAGTEGTIMCRVPDEPGMFEVSVDNFPCPNPSKGWIISHEFLRPLLPPGTYEELLARLKVRNQRPANFTLPLAPVVLVER